MYEVTCVFCKQLHRSEFFDELEETILACRDRAPIQERGLIEAYQDPGIKPISPEVEAYANGLP